MTSLLSTLITTKKYEIKLNSACAVIVLKDKSFDSLHEAMQDIKKSCGHKVYDKKIMFMQSFEKKGSPFLRIVIVFEF